MPKYVVVDSHNKWLEVGEYNTPEEALEGAKQSGDFDTEQKPFNIWVFEYVKEFTFNLDPDSEEYDR